MAQDAARPKKESPIVTEDVNPRLKSPITMRAQDASLSQVLQVLAERSGMNFVTGESVYKEKITIILNKTPLDEAIDLVVRAAGLSYEIIGNSVLIADSDRLNKGEVGQQGYVVALKYANAREVAGMLEKITPNVKVDDGGNRLICFTSPRIINEIERLVKSIDHPHILVMLETRLIEVQITNDNKYGIDWSRLTPIVSGLTHPDVNLGNQWTLLHPTTGTGAGGSGGTNTQTQGNSNGSIGIDLALDLMVSNGDARLLMDSKLTTTNNRPASLHIGEVTPYEVQAYNMGSNGGAGGNISVQKEETGIKINMEPHVNENNQVTITVEPEVSNVVAFVGKNKDLPQVQVRKTKTTVRVQDGQTVFIAGLLREEKTVNISKVPVLGDIPVLGLLFQNKKEKRIKTNLILEITPRILHDSTLVSRNEFEKEVDDNSGTSSSQSTDTKAASGTAVTVSPAAAAQTAPPAQNAPAPAAQAAKPAVPAQNTSATLPAKPAAATDSTKAKP
jgi:type II secretory pathway component GspD/PulD (secretin)